MRHERGRRPRKKVCAFCVDKVQDIDYKEVGRIRKYISEREKSFLVVFLATVLSTNAS